MKIFIQVIDIHTCISQYGMIDEPVQKGFELANALKHFGVELKNVNWQSQNSKSNFEFKYGNIEGTTKVVTAIMVVSDQPANKQNDQ